jgi:hypothetical protein
MDYASGQPQLEWINLSRSFLGIDCRAVDKKNSLLSTKLAAWEWHGTARTRQDFTVITKIRHQGVSHSTTSPLY